MGYATALRQALSLAEILFRSAWIVKINVIAVLLYLIAREIRIFSTFLTTTR